MSDAPATDAATLLVYALDESRQARNLLRVGYAGLSYRRSGWRSLRVLLLQTREEFSAGLAVQYFGENLERTRGRWRAGLAFFDELFTSYRSNETVRRLGDDLERAGLRKILTQLQDDAVPVPRKQATAHLEVVLDQMRECERIGEHARSSLMLQQMGDEQP